MLKKFIVLFSVMMIIGLGILVVADDAVGTDYNPVTALESLGIKVDMGFDLDARNNVDNDIQCNTAMPQLRRVSHDTPITITSEYDVFVLLDTLALIFEATNHSVFVDGSIIAALNDAGLREYWSQGIKELLREENAQRMSELSVKYTVAQLDAMRNITRLDVPRTELLPGQRWTRRNPIFWFGMEMEFNITHTLDRAVHGILDVGTVDHDFGHFNFLRALQPRNNEWRTELFVVITRHGGNQNVGFLNRSPGSTALITFQGHVWLFGPAA